MAFCLASEQFRPLAIAALMTAVASVTISCIVAPDSSSVDVEPELLSELPVACTFGVAWDTPLVTDTPDSAGTLCWAVSKAVWTRDAS